MDFGEKLKQARLACNMSQNELAKAAGISLKTIQLYEKGTRTPRYQANYDKLASALGISSDSLIDNNTSFILKAQKEYGSHGADQAMEMVSEITAMWAGGEMEEEDMDAIMQAMQEAYWEVKKKNRKYVNSRYQNPEE